jgi:hypothetical protein
MLILLLYRSTNPGKVRNKMDGKVEDGGTGEEAAQEPVQALSSDLDWFLQDEQKIANYFGGPTVGVTLLVGGVCVTGVIVSGREWFEAVAEGVRGANYLGIQGETADEVRELMAEPYKRLASLYPDTEALKGEKDPERQSELAKAAAADVPVFIHLKSARIFVPGQPLFPNHGVWWRGKLSAVDGFFVGNPDSWKP